MKRIGMIGPFDPTLCDGVSSSMFDLLSFLKKEGHDVFIVSFMHDTPLCRHCLQYLLDHERITKINRGDSFCNVIYEGINIYWEILPYNRLEMLYGRSEVLNKSVIKLKDYSQSFIFTVDCDFTSLLSNSIIESPGAHFFHSPSYIKNFIENPFYIKLLRSRMVFAVSKFFQNELKEKLNINAAYWPPFINAQRYRTKKKGIKSIGFYSTGPHKGDRIVLKLIEKMPHFNFVIMGRHFSFEKKTLPKNVECMGNITDPKLFYKRISLLIVPSIIPEGYSRVVIEAFQNGIPVIANKIGGLTESLGDGGVLIDIEESENKIVRKYISAIDKLLTNTREYSKYSKMALERAMEYEKELFKISAYNYTKFLM